VWGMPGEAVAIGAAEKVLPLQEISEATSRLSESMDITRR
jgi:chemotaxis response regulator CheB